MRKTQNNKYTAPLKRKNKKTYQKVLFFMEVGKKKGKDRRE